ncbi:hypothetical protein ACFVYC_02685 [Pseudarthrobacter sp. NPDC058329]|uniref:hypothetical protein n=1 Tax=Pseudarthrobacter sp. NPDC058329 TaxID=3346448 RepID=UPI0036DE93A8
MKRILTALGVASFSLLGATATAFASDESSGGEKITICHATGSETNPYVPVTISLNALNAHLGHQHGEDIIPGNDGKVLPYGRNWTSEGKATHNNGCGPVEVPPIVPPENPPVVPPAEVPPAVVPPEVTLVVPPAEVPPAVVPPGVTLVVPEEPAPGEAAEGGGGGPAVAVNEGFNVQTAVSEAAGPVLAPWLGGPAAVLLAGVAVVARQTLHSHWSTQRLHRG